MSDRLTIVLALEPKAVTQYQNYPFDSVVEFQGKGVFFGSGGIYEEGGGDHNGTDIAAWFDLPLHDFGSDRQKSIEALRLGYEAGGSLTVTLTPDEQTAYARALTIAPTKSAQVQQVETITLPKVANGKGGYWGVRVANVAGCDFSVDYLALAPVFLRRRSL